MKRSSRKENLWKPSLESLVGKRVALVAVIKSGKIVFEAAILQKDRAAENGPSMRIPIPDHRVRPCQGEVWTGTVSSFTLTKRSVRIKNAQRAIIEVRISDMRRVKEEAIHFHKGNLSLVRKKGEKIKRDSIRATKEIVQFRRGKSIITYTEVRVSGKPVARFHRKTRKIRLPMDNNIPTMPSDMRGEMAYLPWERILEIATQAA